jgi:hypothetical protein
MRTRLFVALASVMLAAAVITAFQKGTGAEIGLGLGVLCLVGSVVTLRREGEALEGRFAVWDVQCPTPLARLSQVPTPYVLLTGTICKECAKYATKLAFIKISLVDIGKIHLAKRLSLENRTGTSQFVKEIMTNLVPDPRIPDGVTNT